MGTRFINREGLAQKNAKKNWSPGLGLSNREGLINTNQNIT